MRKLLFFIFPMAILMSCNNEQKKEPAPETTTPEVASDKAPADLPYTASYSSNFNEDVSDADLKMVLNSYKDWADGNIDGLTNAIADTLSIEAYTGKSSKMTNAELKKMWKGFRDSLSSVKIDMQAWQKMHSVDKNENYILCWYKEYDTYKDGRVDSASWHDINQVNNGKITWYSQFKRPLK